MGRRAHAEQRARDVLDLHERRRGLDGSRERRDKGLRPRVLRRDGDLAGWQGRVARVQRVHVSVPDDDGNASAASGSGGARRRERRSGWVVWRSTSKRARGYSRVESERRHCRVPRGLRVRIGDERLRLVRLERRPHGRGLPGYRRVASSPPHQEQEGRSAEARIK